MFYFGSNTKSSLGAAEHHRIIQAATHVAKTHSDVQIFILPSTPFFREGKAQSLGTSLWIGNQSLSSIAGQDITGEISAATLKALGSDLVMIAHAERRRLFDGEAEIAIQLRAAEKEGLRVLFCIGEKAQAQNFKALRKLLKMQLEPLAHHSLDLVIAYEPVFSIGVDGIPADVPYVDKVLTLIKEELSELNLANAPLLYGGSVDQHNAALYGALIPCDGLFVGRSAWSDGGFESVFMGGYAAAIKKL